MHKYSCLTIIYDKNFKVINLSSSQDCLKCLFFFKYRRGPYVHLPVVFWCEELPVVDQLQGVDLDPVPRLHPHLLQLLVPLHQMLDLRPLRQKVGLIPCLLDLFIFSDLKKTMK